MEINKLSNYDTNSAAITNDNISDHRKTLTQLSAIKKFSVNKISILRKHQYFILLRARFHILTHQWVDDPAGKWRKHTQKRKHLGITVLSTVKVSIHRHHCWWECNLVKSLCKTTWQLVIHQNSSTYFDPAILFFGIYHRKIITHDYTCEEVYM